MTKIFYLFFAVTLMLGCNKAKSLHITTRVLDKDIATNSITFLIQIQNTSNNNNKVAIQNPLIGFNMQFELIDEGDTLYYYSNVSPHIDPSNYLILDPDMVYKENVSINRFGIPVEGSESFKLQSDKEYSYIIYYTTDNEYYDLLNYKEKFKEFYGFDPSIIITEDYVVKGIVE